MWSPKRFGECHRQRQRQFRFALYALLAVTFFSCVFTPVTARSRDKEGRRRSDRLSTASSTSASSSSPYYSSSGSNYAGGSSLLFSAPTSYNGPMDTTGFCTRRRDMKLMCYCTPDENHVPVQKAECWVFSDGLLQNDTTWTRFFQQKRLRELKFVIQNHGRLDFIPTMVLEPLKNLSSITIEYSQVEVVRSNAFANLPFLERLILTNNQITDLESDAFANHIRLRELNLEHNLINDMDPNSFRNLPQCERLFLNNNNISIVHDAMFEEMARLVYLTFAHNNIKELRAEFFKGLGNLNVLKLSHNIIEHLGNAVFSELWSLTELHLDNNHLTTIKERCFDGLNSLKTLNMRGNNLKKIDNGLLRGTPALVSVNVQANELETLSFYAFQPIMDNLVNSSSELFLGENDFICDCRLLWIFELKNRTRFMQLRDSLEEIVCTLQDPKLSHFVDPVPNHILDLLNIGAGFNSGSGEMHFGGSSARKRLSKSRQGGGQRLGGGLQRMGQLHEDHVLSEEQRRRRQVPAATQEYGDLAESSVTDNNNMGMSSSSSSADNQPEVHNAPTHATSHNIIPDKKKKSVLPSLARDDYYDELGGHGLLMAQQVELGEGLDALKHNAIYNQHNNDVIGMATNTITEETYSSNDNKPQPLGIKVRLFTLRADKLPCADDLNDPTELPLSRDLMDVRSNTGNNASFTGGGGIVRQWPWMCTILAAVLMLGRSSNFGGSGVLVAVSLRRQA